MAVEGGVWVWETVRSRDAAPEPTWTTHMDVGSVPKRRERVGAGFTACLTHPNPTLNCLSIQVRKKPSC